MALVTMMITIKRLEETRKDGEIDACYVNLKERSGENNWVKRFVGVKRADKRSFKKKLARSRLTWAGHVKTMGEEKLANRTDAQNAEGKRRREDQNCDGRTALGGILKIKRKNEEQEQKTEGIGYL